MEISPENVLSYWFYQVGPSRWFTPDGSVDRFVHAEFMEAYECAASEGLASWKETPEGALALILLLDVFPRCMFRATARAYETDQAALDLARESVIRHFDDRIDRNFKLFLYLPFCHSESADDQRLAVFYVRERVKDIVWVDYAYRQKALIDQFGRFPERNACLGRVSTPEEERYLQDTKVLADQQP